MFKKFLSSLLLATTFLLPTVLQAQPVAAPAPRITVQNEGAFVARTPVLNCTGLVDCVVGTGKVNIDGFSAMARAFRASAQSIPDNTNTKIQLDGEAFDTASMHDNVTNNTRITVPRSGKYLVIGQVGFAANATGIRQLILSDDAGNGLARVRLDTNGTGEWHNGVLTVATLAAGGFMELIVLQTSGGALNVNGGAAGEDTNLSVIYLGP